ncbi:kinase-like domain-containing protein [Aspergillus pseudonomiae]|nr:kinase-like domain-containing protein [Aspergillus pseudonomiae]
MVLYNIDEKPISLELPDPTKTEMDFIDTSFFTTSPDRHLPEAAHVRALSMDIGIRAHPTPIKFENLNLIVKFGPHVTTLEALNLWMIKKVFHDRVPVPELFGWRIDTEGYVFIYMELIQGPTLQECWDCLSSMDKRAISSQLSLITKTLRRLEQDSSDQFIGSISRQHLLDYVFIDQPRTGPFPTLKAFNDWFASLHQLRFSHRYDDPNRCLLPDIGDIKFTHGDLNRRNIIVSSTNPVQIVVVDWQQAGWYPDYWEYCKALFTCWYEDEWRKDFIDKFLQPRTDVYFVFSEYTMAMGAV